MNEQNIGIPDGASRQVSKAMQTMGKREQVLQATNPEPSEEDILRTENRNEIERKNIAPGQFRTKLTGEAQSDNRVYILGTTGEKMLRALPVPDDQWKTPDGRRTLYSTVLNANTLAHKLRQEIVTGKLAPLTSTERELLRSVRALDPHEVATVDDPGAITTCETLKKELFA